LNLINSNRQGLFSVRRSFLLACAAFLVVMVLPNVAEGRHTVQLVFLVLAALAIASGWFFLLKYREPNSTWRALIALITSVYLTVSIPVFFFELSQIRWFTRHPGFSMYARPWVHWGYVFVYLGVAGAFLGRGRSRIAFVVASTLLMILWEGTGTWVF